jgi:IS5 family transposase
VTGRARGRLRRAVNELAVLIQRTGTVIGQAWIRLAGGKPDAATRVLCQNSSHLV